MPAHMMYSCIASSDDLPFSLSQADHLQGCNKSLHLLRVSALHWPISAQQNSADMDVWGDVTLPVSNGTRHSLCAALRVKHAGLACRAKHMHLVSYGVESL